MAGWQSVKYLGAVIALAACSPEAPRDGVATGAVAPEQTPPPIRASVDIIKAHMGYLASDALEGREAGTPGYDKAADYVAGEFAKLGLKPAGQNGTYFQTVPFRRSYRNADAVGLSAVHADGTTLELEEYVDFAVGGSIQAASSEVTAPVVFAGYGIVAPEEGRDDYAGLDVAGKIVATLARTPSGIQSEERAFYGSRKASEASKRGALGVISLETPTSEAIFAFQRLVAERRLDTAQMSWVTPEGKVFTRAPGLQVGASISRAGAAKLFAHAPTSWSEIETAAEAEGGITPTFELPVTMTIRQGSTLDDVISANVAGLIEGSDPALKNEVIVLSAHLDHIGITKTIETDRINNGALDNAAGVSTLLEAARIITSGPRPRRSILFLAVTAEEKGLLGSQYFAENPTLPADHIVGNINLDMPVLTYNFTDVIVFGGNRSTLRSAIETAAADMGIAIGPDPFPAQGIFTRSDHFRFVETGVPSVMLSTGFANGGEQAWGEHFAQNYHRPSDDLKNNLNYQAAAKFAELKTRIAYTVANAETRPLWEKDDFFARQFNGPQRSEASE